MKGSMFKFQTWTKDRKNISTSLKKKKKKKTLFKAEM